MVTSFQHCLTEEILSIVESSVDMGQRYGTKHIIADFVRYNCQLAVSAQQLNQLSRLDEAAALTDLTHFFAMYGRSILDDELEAAGWQAFGTGVTRAVVKWGQFAYNLGAQPKQTMADLVQTCFDTVEFLAALDRQIYDRTPLHYVGDIADDFQDLVFSDVSKNIDFAAKIKKRDKERAERNQKSLDNVMLAAQRLMSSIQQKPAQENVADAVELIVDNILTGKITQGLFNLCQIIGDKTLQAAQSFQNMLPADVMHSPISIVETNAGHIVAIIESTGESVGDIAVAKAAVDRIAKLAENVTRTQDLINKLNTVVKPDQEKVAAFHESMKSYLNSEKLIDIERLRSIEGVEQIDNFKKYTNNFHPDDIVKLKPEEILYLNLCDWLHEKSSKINEALKKKGGMRVIDSVTGAEAYYEKYDFFHSLLGEMSPEALANRTKGGHLMIPELRSATLEAGIIKPFNNGFFDMEIQYLGKSSIKYKNNSYYPIGVSVNESIEMLEESIINFKEIKCTIDTNGKAIVEITGLSGQKFGMYINDKIAIYFPIFQ